MIPDLVLRNARVVGGADDPVDVAIDAGRVTVLGVIEEIGRTELDVDGRWLLPGLWDHHVHFAQWALVRRRLDVSAAVSASGAAAIVGARLRAELNSDVPLVGFGYRSALWTDEPSAALLDAVSPHRPVALLSGDMHGVWINTAAAERYGAPHAGALAEADAFRVQRLLETEAPQHEELFVSEAAADAAARGIVGIVDLDMGRTLEAWARRTSGGLRAFRVSAGFYPPDLERTIEAGMRTGDVLDGTGGLVSVGPLKIITDGSLNTRTALCHEPYTGGGDGVLNYAPDEVDRLFAVATENGLSVAAHAIGDKTVSLVLDAFERSGARGSIEHAQLVSGSDIGRFAALDVAASVQPEHLWDDRDVADALWAGRTERAYPYGALAAAGARLTLGSDAPVAPLDPWRGIAAAVHRTADEREPWHPEQHLTREQALVAATRRARVDPGMVADVVVVDANPLAAAPDELRDMAVSATLVGGHFTHRTF